MRRVLLTSFISIALAATACNLSDPLDGRPAFDAAFERDAKSPGSDAADAGDATSQMPDDGLPSDADADAPDARDTDTPDMGEPVTAATLYEDFAQTLCESILRIDYQPSNFWYWTSPADCVETLLMFNRDSMELLAHDAEQGRLTIDVAEATALLQLTAAIDHPKDVEELDVFGPFRALSGNDSPCASSTSCLQSGLEEVTCLKGASTNCEGVCGTFDRRCDDAICGLTQYCAPGAPRTCVDQQADGTPCASDEQCQNHCIVNTAGVGTCGVIALDGDCSSYASGCDEGLYCEPIQRTCRPIAADGQRCVIDQGCQETSVCQNDTCVAIGEGTPCRDGLCTAGHFCLPVSTTDSTRACYASRATGDPCATNDMCPASDLCDFSQAIPVCRARRQVGEPCSFSGQCGGDLTCRRTLVGMEGTCEPWQWGLAEGEVCFDDAATCSFGLFCVEDAPDSLRGTCQLRTRPVVGETCETLMECADGYCFEGDVCSPWSAPGEACSSQLQCENAFCAGSPRACTASICP